MKSAFVLSLLAAAAFSTAAVAGNIKSDATAVQPQPKTVAMAPQKLTDTQMDKIVAGTVNTDYWALFNYGGDVSGQKWPTTCIAEPAGSGFQGGGYSAYIDYCY